ncbi:MAG: hypothetical protein ACHQJ6_06630 [Candidatus Berkiellales bacterium]
MANAGPRDSLSEQLSKQIFEGCMEQKLDQAGYTHPLVRALNDMNLAFSANEGGCPLSQLFAQVRKCQLDMDIRSFHYDEIYRLFKEIIQIKWDQDVANLLKEIESSPTPRRSPGMGFI